MGKDRLTRTSEPLVLIVWVAIAINCLMVSYVPVMLGLSALLALNAMCGIVILIKRVDCFVKAALTIISGFSTFLTATYLFWVYQNDSLVDSIYFIGAHYLIAFLAIGLLCLHALRIPETGEKS